MVMWNSHKKTKSQEIFPIWIFAEFACETDQIYWIDIGKLVSDKPNANGSTFYFHI